ncbi:hypothetical protein DB43_FJ00150 [Parachlamydia acanthamoebae]|uniref:Uncharacterized protein n=1 Tax=Parachlamydia acanthamoebae TaxID=83552 RepID=A0A0C1E9V0_9BACT|nr:hypothetical protein DB43_FJ00150 [Parachlamydia acanthamoebae]
MKNESFINLYKAKHPSLKMKFSPRTIQRISGVFGINKTLFYSSHFAEI